MHDEDQYDLSSEIEEGKREAFIHRCAMRDMDQGIRPTYWDEPNEDNEVTEETARLANEALSLLKERPLTKNEIKHINDGFNSI
jgi:hypothetical protein